MFKAGQKVKVLYRSTKKANGVKGALYYAIGTLVWGTDENWEKTLTFDLGSTKKMEQFALGKFVGIKVLD